MITIITNILDYIYNLLEGKKPMQIMVGSTYRINNDPFHNSNVKVVDIKNGYVKFVHEGMERYSRSMSVKDFKLVYSIEVK